MNRYRLELIETIQRWHLDQKLPSQTKSGLDWRQVLIMAQQLLISDSLCNIYLHLMQEDIEHLTDFPDYLHRLPELEQLHRDGKPDIRYGALADAPDMEIGLRFDGPLFMLLAGLTGYGKTTAVRVILRAIHKYNLAHPDKKIIVIVLDRKGGDYADLPKLFGWKHYDVYSTLRLSLENPPGVPPQVWINLLSTLFCARAGLKAAWATLANSVRYLLAQLNPNPTQRLIWPDFQLLLDFLRSIPETTFSSKPEYTRSLIQAIEAITKSTAQTFQAFQGFRVQDLINAGQSAIISMPNMDPSWARQLLSDILISQYLRQKIHCSDRSNFVRFVFVIDEADADINQHSELMFDDQMCPISAFFKLSREFGGGMIVSISSLQSASRLVLENATYYTMFRTSNYESTIIAARTLMLPPHGELTFGHLEQGQALVKQVGHWPHTMKVQVDAMAPCRTPITKYDSHYFMPAKRMHEIPAVMTAAKALRDAHDKRKKQNRDKEQAKQLSDQAKELLQLAISHPYIPLARLFDKMGELSFSAQKAIRKELEDYANFEEIRIERANVLLIEPNEKAYKLFGQTPPRDENQGRGGLTHRSFAHWIKRCLESQGLKAGLEYILPGTNHPVDVAAESNNHLEIFEISITATENLLSHIMACFEQTTANVVRLNIVTTQKQIARKLEQAVLSELHMARYINNINFITIQSYIPKEI